MKKSLNDIAAIEKAIEKKYGTETIRNPKSNWTPEKEKKYLRELKNFYMKKEGQKEKKRLSENFYIKERKDSVQLDRDCPVCGVYSFSSRDDLYMAKFECCYKCYVSFIEGREDRWFSGWRPNI
mgnify:CR=1 FL=1